MLERKKQDVLNLEKDLIKQKEISEQLGRQVTTLQ